MGLFKDSKGKKCEILPSGGLRCRIYKVENNQKLATGSDFEINAVPENNCEPTFGGTGFDYVDEDDKDIMKVASMMKKACQKGLG